MSKHAGMLSVGTTYCMRNITGITIKNHFITRANNSHIVETSIECWKNNWLYATVLANLLALVELE